MSDDSFIREVDDELRQDQAKQIWNSYGTLIVGAAIAVVIGTAAWTGYSSWVKSKANASGDAFSQALTLSADGKTEEAEAALAAMQADSYGAYPLLARMRLATLAAEKGDAAGAVTAFDAVAADTSVPGPIRDLAKLRAAYLLVDSGSYADVASRAETLTGETNALRHSAREALGLSAWKEGKSADALALFSQIATDDAAPRNARKRADLMAKLLAGSGA